MTPTPRTDAIAHRRYNESAYIAEMTDTARKLERELAKMTENWGRACNIAADDGFRANRLERELAQWQAELSKVMPPDFKDWWENSKAEWPLVARLVIEGKNRELAAKDEEITILRSDEKRLVGFAKTYRARADDLDDTLAAERTLADRLAETMRQIADGCNDAWCRDDATVALAAWKEARHE